MAETDWDFGDGRISAFVGERLLVVVTWEEAGFDSESLARATMEDFSTYLPENNGREGYYAQLVLDGEPVMLNGIFMRRHRADLKRFAADWHPRALALELGKLWQREF